MRVLHTPPLTLLKKYKKPKKKHFGSFLGGVSSVYVLQKTFPLSERIFQKKGQQKTKWPPSVQAPNLTTLPKFSLQTKKKQTKNVRLVFVSESCLENKSRNEIVVR